MMYNQECRSTQASARNPEEGSDASTMSSPRPKSTDIAYEVYILMTEEEYSTVKLSRPHGRTLRESIR